MYKEITLTVILVMLISCVNFAYAQNNNQTDLVDLSTEQAVKGPEIIAEKVDLRLADEKHFRLSDGSFLAAKYTEPVHYKKMVSG